MALFSRPRLSAAERQGLLVGSHESSPLVCACFGVGRDRIVQAIQERGLSTLGEIGTMLRAGTNCGSWVPELRALLTLEMTRARARTVGVDFGAITDRGPCLTKTVSTRLMDLFDISGYV